eukprot:3198229-Rhodomonas_salina.4
MVLARFRSIAHAHARTRHHTRTSIHRHAHLTTHPNAQTQLARKRAYRNSRHEALDDLDAVEELDSRGADKGDVPDLPVLLHPLLPVPVHARTLA